MKKITWSHRTTSTAVACVCVTIGWMFWSAGNVRGDQTPPGNLSPALQKVVELAQAHMNDDVILAYIKNSGASYTLTADDILHLKDQGVSRNVITALLQSKPAEGPNPAAANPPPGNPPSSPPQENTPPINALPVVSTPATPIPVPAQDSIPRNGSRGETGGMLRIVSGDGDFSSITAANKILNVAPGATLRGTVKLLAINLAPPDAVAPLIYTPSWGDHRTSWREIKGWVPAGQSEQVGKLSFTAPSSAGTYYVIFAFAWEIGGDHVAAASNWGLGAARWDDGNDLASLNNKELADAQAKGYTAANWLNSDGHYSPMWVPADALTIVVGETPQVPPPSPPPAVAPPLPVASASLADNFASDRGLNTELWTTQSSLLNALAQMFESSWLAPSLNFGPTGMRMSGVNGSYEFTGIQSLAAFEPPFMLTTRVMGTVANGNPFEVILVSSDLSRRIEIAGNLNRQNGGYYGIWANGVGNRLLYHQPSVGVPYTIRVTAGPDGNAVVSLFNSNGVALGSQGDIQIGTGPLYAVLAQREGSPFTVGPNVATWQSASITHGAGRASLVRYIIPGIAMLVFVGLAAVVVKLTIPRCGTK